MLKNKKKLRRLERNTPGYAARTAQTLVLAGALVLGGAAMAGAADVTKDATGTVSNADLSAMAAGDKLVVTMNSGGSANVTVTTGDALNTVGGLDIKGATNSSAYTATLDVTFDSSFGAAVNVGGGTVGQTGILKINSGKTFTSGTLTTVKDYGTVVLNGGGIHAGDMTLNGAGAKLDVVGGTAAAPNIITQKLTLTEGDVDIKTGASYLKVLGGDATTAGVSIVKGTMTVGNGSSNKGTIEVTNGTKIASGGNLAKLVLDDGTHIGNITLDGGSTNAGNTQLAGGTNGGTVLGDVVVTAGKIDVSGGDITIKAANGVGGGLTMGANSSWDLTTNTLTVGTLTANKALDVEGKLNLATLLGSAKLTLKNGGAISYTDGINRTEATLHQSTHAAASGLFLGDGGSLTAGTLNLKGFDDSTKPLTAANGVTLDVDNLVLDGNTTIGAAASNTHSVTINGTEAGDFLSGGNLTLIGATSGKEATLQLGSANSPKDDAGKFIAQVSDSEIKLVGTDAATGASLLADYGNFTVKSATVGAVDTAGGFGTIAVGSGNNGGTFSAETIALYGDAAADAKFDVGTGTMGATATVGKLIVGAATGGTAATQGQVNVEGATGAGNGALLTINEELSLAAGSELNVKGFGTVDASKLTNMGSQAGKIDVAANGTLKTGNLTIDNVKLTSTSAANGTINVNATGTLDVNGALSLKGASTGAVTTSVAGNVLVNTLNAVDSANAKADLIWNAGDLTIRGGADVAGTSIFNGDKLTIQGGKNLNLTAATDNGGGTYTGTLATNGGTLNVTKGTWSSNKVDVASGAASTLTVSGGTLTILDSLKTVSGSVVTVNGTGTLQAKLSNFGVIKDDKTIDRAGTGATVNSSTKVGGNGRLQLDGTSGYAGDLTLDQAVAIRSGVIDVAGGATASLKLTEYNINATVADKLTKANGLELPTATLGLENSQSLTANTIVKNLGVHSSATDVAIGVTVGPNATFTMIGDGANNKLITGTLKDNQVVTFTLDPAGGLTLGDATGTTRTGGILNANVAGSGTLAAYNGDFTLAGTVSNTTDIEGKGTNIVSEKDLSIAGVNLETGTLRTASDKDLTVSGAVTLKGDGSGIASGKDLTLGSAFATQEDGGKSVLSAAGKLTALGIDSRTHEDTSSVAIQATTLDAGNVVLGKGSTLVTTGTGYGTDGTGSTVNSLMMKRATGSVGDLKVTTVTSIYNGSSLDVKGTLTATQGIFVGADTDVDGSTLTVNKLDLNNATLFVDPTWVDGVYNPSQVAVKSFVGDKINGNIGVGRNSQVTLGSDDPAWLDAQVQKLGNWNKDGITAALGVYAPQTLGTGQGIVVDGTKTMTTPPAFAANTVNFADNSLLVVNAAGLGDKAALTAETKGAIVIADKAKLRITGVQSGKTVKVLDNFDVTTGITADKGWSEKNGNLSTDSRMMYGTLRIDDANDAINVDIHARAAQFVFPKLSGPMAGLVDGFYAQGLYDVDSPAAGIRFMSRATSETHMYSAEAAAATIEGAAQMGAVAGVQISTMGAANAASGAALTRTSFAQPLMDMTKAVAVNQDVDGNLSLDTGLSAGDGMKNGLGVWIMPLYQSNRTWGQKAENFKTGMSSDLGGIALGADYTINDMFRFGAAFNVGGGYAQSSGDFNKTDNNFNFWGVNLYGGWTMNNFGLSADVGYTSNYNKVEQEVPASMLMGNLKSDITSSAWSAGLKGEYKFETSVVDIIPHIGVRYMGLTTDSYDVKSGGTVFSVERDFQSIWTFPIGVAFNKTISTDSGWMFKPQVDLSVIPAAGDVKAKSKASIPGVMGDAEMKMQVVDYVTFDGGVGLEMGKDNLSFGINYNIQASEHRTGHGVFGTLRYEF